MKGVHPENGLCAEQDRLDPIRKSVSFGRCAKPGKPFSSSMDVSHQSHAVDGIIDSEPFRECSKEMRTNSRYLRNAKTAGCVGKKVV